jgi:hypothetical protein
VVFVISGSALLYVVNTLWDKKPVVAGKENCRSGGPNYLGRGHKLN